MSQSAKLLAPSTPPLSLPAERLERFETLARGLYLGGAEVVALGLQLLEEQLESDTELVCSRVLELRAQCPGGAAAGDATSSH
jgi:hypothetical protein